MDNLLNSGITYQSLDRTLQELGFRKTLHENQRRYENQEAIILLPCELDMKAPARAVHLLTARHTVTGFGFADEAEFEKLLTAPARPVAHSAERTTLRGASAKRRSRVPIAPAEVG